VSRPVRTCIGCRRQAAKSELVRLVWQQTVVVDPFQREPGRGAYLHRGPDCLAQAVRRRAVTRALRITGYDPDALTRRWAEQVPEQVA
jgi:predicted RNA-binding protein YlxR (DUF448 family)